MWKVDLREVTFLGSDEHFDNDTHRIGNITQFFRHRALSVGGEVNRRAYTTIGEYGVLTLIYQLGMFRDAHFGLKQAKKQQVKMQKYGQQVNFRLRLK